MSANVLLGSIFAILSLANMASGDVPIFTTGIPERGVEKLDPVVIESVKVPLPNLKMTLYNVTVKGLSKCLQGKSKYSNNELKFKIHCELTPITMRGRYHAQSKQNPKVEAKGRMFLVLNKAKIDLEYFVQKSMKDGLRHFKPKHPSYDYQLSYKAKDIGFENAIDEIGEALTEYSKHNDIVMAVSKPVMDNILVRVDTNLQRYFFVTPLKEMNL